MNAAALYFEDLLAPILGLTREDLRYLRKEALKKEGRGHWFKQGRDVVLTQPGLDLLLERLRAASNEPPAELDFTRALVNPPAQKKEEAGEEGGDQATAVPPGATAPAELVTFKVKSCYPNPSMLRALHPDGRTFDVRVMTNKNFIPGMELHARLGRDGKWKMEGRCPRQRGRY